MSSVSRTVRAITGNWLPYGFLWALSRAYLGWELIHRVGYIVGDVNYYFAQLDSTDVRRTLVEYPTPVVWGLRLLRDLTGGDQQTFLVGFMICMVVLDAWMVVLLWRHGGSGRAAAVLTWIVFITFMGPLAYARFDLAPALVAGAAALFVHRRPALAGALVAVGAALKLWPALLVLPLLGRTSERLRSAVGFVVVGVGLALASLVTSGWDRTVSPLTWQVDRGLQIESVPATVVMWWRTFDPTTTYQVALSRYNAYEIVGPGVAASMRASTVATVLGIAVIGWLGWRVVRLTERSASTVAAVMLAVILVMIVTNKTLSPQYVFWLGGPICAMVAADDHDSTTVWGAPLLYAAASWIVALFTQQVYPTLYGELVTGRGTGFATSVLVLRNVALVVLTGVTIWYAAARTTPQSEASANRAAGTKSVRMEHARAGSGA